MQDFIASILAEPFQWGRTDCCSIADRWVEMQTRKSPSRMAGYIYETELEAMQIMNAAGGMSSMIDGAMSGAGFQRTHLARLGDVGLVLYERQLCMSIRSGIGWFSRNERGVILVKKPAVRAWAVQCQL